MGRAFGRDDIRCEVRRRTLTPIRYLVPAESGTVGAELLLENYALINGVPWAHTIHLRSGDGDVLIRMRDVELNGEIPAGAFTVPQGATLLR